MKQNKAYFIGGASGSGKTAIIPELKQLLGDTFAIHDFDDIGVPSGADKKWRQKSTDTWLQRLAKEKKNVCLLGQMVLGEILACPSAQRLKKIDFCLLDVNDFERISRLKKRDTYGANQHMLNWASWLRMHHYDPQWEQHVIKENCWKNMMWDTWDQLEHWKNKAHSTILDTSALSLPEVASRVATLVTYQSHQHTTAGE